MISLYFTFSSCCSTFTPFATLLSECLERIILLPKILVQMVSSRLRAVSYRRGLQSRSDKNETDFKRKSRLQAVKVSSHKDSLVWLFLVGKSLKVTFFQVSSLLFQLEQFVKCRGGFFKTEFRLKQLENNVVVSSSPLQNLEFGNFKSQLAVTERNVPKNGMHVQSCCFEYQTFTISLS